MPESCSAGFGLAAALIRPGDRIVSIVGSGGKTSLMFHLAHALQATGQRVITTSTTRILKPKPGDTASLLFLKQKNFFMLLEEALDHFGHVTVVRDVIKGDKLQGLSCNELEEMASLSTATHILVEADGARRLPLKAAAHHEPVVSVKTDLFVAVIGLDCMGVTLDDAHVFRPELVAERSGQDLGSEVTLHTLAKLISHPLGTLKGCPAGSRSVIFLNKTDMAGGIEVARELIETVRACGGVSPSLWLAGSVKNGICHSY